MILVTGAAGHYGTNVIDHLLNKGVEPALIAGLVRDTARAKHLSAKGIVLRVGDYTDPDSLVRAFQGVDHLVLVSSNDRGGIENRTAHHLNVIRAAQEAKVNHIVYTSFVRKPGFADSAIAAFQDSHVKSEQAIKDSGLNYTILQNGIYLEMIPAFTGEKVAETGAILLPAQAGKASWVLREELAEATAQLLTTPGHENKIYPLTNTQAVSYGAIAQAMSDTLGKTIRYDSPEVDVFQATLKQVAVPDAYIDALTMWSVAQAQGALDVVDPTLAALLGRQPTTVNAFIDQVYGSKV